MNIVAVVLGQTDIVADSEVSARDHYTVGAFAAAYSCIEVAAAAAEDNVVAAPVVLVVALGLVDSGHSCFHNSKLQQGHPIQEVQRAAELVGRVVDMMPLLERGPMMVGGTWDHFLLKMRLSRDVVVSRVEGVGFEDEEQMDRCCKEGEGRDQLQLAVLNSNFPARHLLVGRHLGMHYSMDVADCSHHTVTASCKRSISVLQACDHNIGLLWRAYCVDQAMYLIIVSTRPKSMLISSSYHIYSLSLRKFLPTSVEAFLCFHTILESEAHVRWYLEPGVANDLQGSRRG